MTDGLKLLCDEIDKNRDMLLSAERHIWQNPESGYKEWTTHAYLKEKFEALGYTLHEAGDIPGFYTDIDTGRPGPKIAVFGELDSLIIPTHPECNKTTHAVHACGHNCQTAALLGVAAALKAPNALKNMCGSIRLIAVPAEEAIELEYRSELKKKGIIKHFSGKVEFLHRGYLDGVDITFMVHTSVSKTLKGIECNKGSNGCMLKTAEFIGKASHAGGSPHLGRNALYAANTAITAANALRETFRDNDHIRFHPIITEGGTAVNSIPEKVKVESYVRGATVAAIQSANDKINRAFAAAAAAMGCGLKIDDTYGYMPLNNDKNLVAALKDVGTDLFGEEGARLNENWGTGCTDMGDMSSLFPSMHPHINGASGTTHGSDFYITDPEYAVIKSAKFQVGMLLHLLCDNAKQAKKIIAEKQTVFSSKEEYFAEVDSKAINKQAVIYNEDGTISLDYK